MTLALMIYGIVLGSFLAGAAYFLDRGLRAVGRPTRWVWILGMAATVGAPLFSRFLTRPPSPTTQGGPLPADLLYDIMAMAAGPAREPSTFSLSADRPLALLWVFGSFLILLALFWTSRRLSRASKGWEKQRLGSQEFLVSDGLGPAVLGLIRPVIILPSWALSLREDKLEMILLHEKEHQGARDPALLALGLILAAITPWNPGMWWMARRLHLAVEGDCDSRVLARGIPVRSYGNLLLEVASGARGLTSLAPALAEGGNTFLEKRLLMIRSTVRKHRLGAAALAVLASAGLTILACETPTPPTIAEDEAVVEAAPVASDLADAEEGIFLVRKKGENVEYLGSVSPDQLRLIQEDGGEGPASFLIRGRELGGDPAAAEARPLIVVDGVIMSDPDALESLNPDDIESVDVVKGDAAVALFGERATNGVVKITLKR